MEETRQIDILYNGTLTEERLTTLWEGLGPDCSMTSTGVYVPVLGTVWQGV